MGDALIDGCFRSSRAQHPAAATHFQMASIPMKFSLSLSTWHWEKVQLLFVCMKIERSTPALPGLAAQLPHPTHAGSHWSHAHSPHPALGSQVSGIAGTYSCYCKGLKQASGCG